MEAHEAIAEIRGKIQQLEETFRAMEHSERLAFEARRLMDQAAARAAVRRICEQAA